MNENNKKNHECNKTDCEKYKLMVENSNDGIVIVQNGNLKFANQATYRTTGYEESELMNQPIAKLVHPDDRRMIEIYTINRMMGKDAPDKYKFKLLTKKGDIRLVEISVHTTDYEGEYATINFVRDITEKVNAEKCRKALEEQLHHAHKMEAIGTLAGGIAHDFNNILMGIMGYITLAKDMVDDKTVKCLDQSIDGCIRARELISQILTFSRKDISRETVIDVKSLLTDTLKLLRASIPTSTEIAIEITKESCMIFADTTHIHQAIMNLCTNAQQAIGKSGGALTVNLDSVRIDYTKTLLNNKLKEGDFIKLTVKDTGSGMTKKTIVKMYEPFFTTKKPGEGTGMGLSVVHGIIERYDGIIIVDSELDSGTTFEIYLPKHAAEPKKEMCKKAITQKGSEHILFVDDEEMILDTSVEMLKRHGYRITPCKSGDEAFEVFKMAQDDFDLVITDMTMPGMTGDKLAKEIRALSDIPIILCSGYSSDVCQIEVGDITEYLPKPLGIEEMTTSIRSILDV